SRQRPLGGRFSVTCASRQSPAGGKAVRSRCESGTRSCGACGWSRGGACPTPRLHIVRRKLMRLHLFVGAVVSVCVLFGSGCQAGANDTSQTQSALNALTPGPSQNPGVAGAQASPVPVANIDVSPSQVPEGTVTLSLAFEPARHMQDQTMALAAAASN